MVTIQELLRSISMRGTKANVEAFTAGLEEVAFAFSTDTSQLGVYTNGAWEWIGATGTFNVGYTEGAHVYNDANISISNATLTALTFNQERYDTDNIHSTVTNTNRLTCQTAGKYTISASIMFAANATGVRILELHVNGTAIAKQNKDAISAGNQQMSITAPPYSLSVSDFVEIKVFQNTGSPLNVLTSGNFSPEFAMQRIG